MKIGIIIIVTLILLSVTMVLLIKKSVKTQDTKLDWMALAAGSLSVNVTMNLLLPFAVKIKDLKIVVLAGSKEYFQATIKELDLNPKLNIIPVTFTTVNPLNALDVAQITLQKKYLKITGTVLGLEFSRTEELN